MTLINGSENEAWNGDSGRRWVATADERDRVLAPVADALLAVASPSPGTRVLDVGCGCGATTLLAAVAVGDEGSAAGIDFSEPMLDVARQRAQDAGATNTTFITGDAQNYGFEPESADLVISRFGTMFFSNPREALANIGTAVVPAGRLCIATWQPLGANDWLIVPGSALLHHADIPAAEGSGPSMFAQSDPEVITETLGAAGFIDIRVEAVQVTFTLGHTVADAVAYLANSGPGRALLETIPDGAARDAALADVHDVLQVHADGTGVRLDGGILLTTATRRSESTGRNTSASRRNNLPGHQGIIST
jgi:SAM-dependent methyltransferase